MAKKKNYEYRENNFDRDSDGLRQRRLKEESRWKYNPNQGPPAEFDVDEDFDIQEDWD